MMIPKSGLDGLSPRRRRILLEILPQVVPSVYGEAAFRRIDANWKPGSGYTTCGGLPTFVAQQLGVTAQMKKEGMGSYGLTGMRNAAIRRGCWVHTGRTGANPALSCDRPMPRPGDIYILCSGRGHDFGCCTVQKDKDTDPWPKVLGAKVEHIGVIVEAAGNFWLTADAGQSVGTSQAALYVRRHYNAVTGNMTGEQEPKGRPLRRLCGWIDVDRYPFADGHAALAAAA
jgi:hypothetical protein